MTTSGDLTILIKNLHHGGSQKVCVAICNELIKRNYHIELWILDHSQTTLALQLNENIKIINLNEKQVRSSIFKLADLFRKNKPRKLMVFNIELAILAIIIKKIFRINSTIIFRSINTLSQAYKFPQSMWEKFFASPAIRTVLPYCDKIIAQSNGMKEDLIHYFKIDKNKIHTIFNPAINLTELELQENEYRHSANNFLYVGRLRPQKGLDNLINIFSRVKKENPAITLTIVGEGPEKENLEQLTQQLGLTTSVKFMGYQPNPYNFFIKAKATVLTSIYEGFPNVLVESIATGTPVIAFDCPSGPADIIEPEINGILVQNQNLDAFAEAMQMVADDKIKFKKQEVINTSRKFSIDTIVEKYEELIKS